MLITKESRERAICLDESVESVEALLGLQEVQDAIGNTVAGKLLELASGLYVPNIRFGVLNVPESRLVTSDTPFLPLPATSGYKIGRNVLKHNSVQQARLAEHEDGQTLADLSQKAFDDVAETWIGYKKKPTNVASVSFPIRKLDFSTCTPYTVDTAPVMVVNRDTLNVFSNLDKGFVLAHELLHVEQMQMTPVVTGYWAAECMTKSELEAYNLGAAILGALGVKEDDPDLNDLHDFTFRMNAIWREYHDPDAPLEPTRAIRDGFIKAGAIKLRDVPSKGRLAHQAHFY